MNLFKRYFAALIFGILAAASQSCMAQDGDAARRVANAMNSARAMDEGDPAKFIAAVRLFIAEPELISRKDGYTRQEIARLASRWSTPNFHSNAQQTFDLAMRHPEIAPNIVGGNPDTTTMDCVALGTGSKWVGSGVLVSKNVILTSSHLAQDYNLTQVWFGPEVGNTTNGKLLALDEALTEHHPDFRRVDLAVVVLANPVEVKVRERANSNETTAAINVLAVGYGYTNQAGKGVFDVRRSTLMVVSSNPCGGQDERNFCCRTGVEILAGSANKTTCHGDSGGPALAGVKLAGIVRAAATCDETYSRCDMASNFVRTAEHRRWIDDMIQKHSRANSMRFPPSLRLPR